MTNFATEPPTARQELVALITAADKLAERASSLNRTARKIQDRLPDILDKLDAEAAADRTHPFMEKEHNLTHAFGQVGVFVRGVAKSPVVVAAEHTDAPDGSRTWWVVYVGHQGLPQPAVSQKTSKSEALLFYQQKWGEDEVRKWNEVAEDD
ncbi:hypothetical protein B0H13DRAFT_1866318 [Mycena leptocephala]|nr:hypothetical protein B0H13DRAFT_1866318 [Mycena leptocephala]